MKKEIYVLVLAIFLIATNLNAQQIGRKGYFNIGANSANLIDNNGRFNDFKIKNDWGLHLTRGKSYFLNKEPVVGLLKFAVDVSFIDLNYNQFDMTGFHIEEDVDNEYGYEDEIYQEDYIMRKIEAGIHLGPSVHVFPISNVQVSSYFRYAPSYAASLYTAGEEFEGGFASFYVLGVSANYNFIGIGIESRWGATKGKSFFEELSDGYEDVRSNGVNMRGSRFYISFRF